MIIYNVVYYLQDQTGLTIKANGIPAGHKGNINTMTLVPGFQAASYNRNDYNIKLLVKHSEEVEGFEIINTLYKVYENIFNFKLPEVTVNSIVYPEVTVAQCSPNQSPGYIGTDENGLHMYTVNFRFIV